MAEYDFVEKPFLNQLSGLGWKVVDQGLGIPQDPAKSHRTTFREWVLKDIFTSSVRAINVLDDGRPWLTEKQLDDVCEELTHQPVGSLVEANQNILRLLFKHDVDENEITNEENPEVKLIDFQHPARNHFHAINQFRIDTPGQVKSFICPDIVLFVNGLPVVVVECKDTNAYTANPMHEAFEQLMRYSEQREETKLAGLREGEPRLFHFNQLLIRTCGDQADFGTITSTDEDYFFPWKDIYPSQFGR